MYLKKDSDRFITYLFIPAYQKLLRSACGCSAYPITVPPLQRLISTRPLPIQSALICVPETDIAPKKTKSKTPTQKSPIRFLLGIGAENKFSTDTLSEKYPSSPSTVFPMVGKERTFSGKFPEKVSFILIDHFAQFIKQAVDTFHQFVAKESIMFFHKGICCVFSAGWFAIS